jgi:hypothetical protein
MSVEKPINKLATVTEENAAQPLRKPTFRSSAILKGDFLDLFRFGRKINSNEGPNI